MGEGMFITVEGIDGAGKSTHLQHIVDTVKAAGFDTCLTREPGGTRFGERLRQALLHDEEIDISPRAETLAMFAARAQHLHAVIEPALADGVWVICDRFTEATYAYQGGGRELGFEAIATLESWTQGDRRPDLTLVFDVSGEIAASRIGHAGRVADRFERESDTFRERVRDAYADLAQRHPERIIIVDASGSIDAVAQAACATVRHFIDVVCQS